MTPNMSNGKLADFVLFPLFGFTLVIKLIKFDFESHWNTSKNFNKKRCGSDLNMSHNPLFGFSLVIKLRNCDFESCWNTLKSDSHFLKKYISASMTALQKW